MINVYFICSALNLLYVSVRVKPFVCITLMKVTWIILIKSSFLFYLLQSYYKSKKKKNVKSVVQKLQ